MLGDATLLKICAKKGPEEVDPGVPSELYIHKTLLQNASPYFRALKNFKEDQEGVIELKDVSPKAFGVFAQWLYSGKLPSEPIYLEIDNLVNTYMFADRVLVPKLKNFIIDEIQNLYHSNFISLSLILSLQEKGIAQTDGLMMYFIDCVAYTAAVNDIEMFASDRLKGEDQEFFRSGGDLVSMLINRMSCVWKEARRGYVWGGSPAPQDPAQNLTGYYHDDREHCHKSGTTSRSDREWCDRVGKSESGWDNN